MSIALAAVSVFTAAVARARTVDLAAYTLRPGAVRDALLVAARAGARIRVRLEAEPFDDPAQTLHRANAATVAILTAAGADAALTPAGAPVLHMKAAVVDGIGWLDDRNWSGARGETVVRDSDPPDVAALSSALQGGPDGDGPLKTTKAGAQRLELDVIGAALDGPLDVESESFGGGALYSALLARARAGAPTRLLVAGREASAPDERGRFECRRLAHLAELGVEVRTGLPGTGDLDEKLAVTPAAAWVGSANATYAGGAAGLQRDWGLATRDAPVVDGLRAAFEANWRSAHPFGDGTLPGAPCAPSSASTSAARLPV